MTEEELQAIREHIQTPVILSQDSLDSDAWPVIHQAWRERVALLVEVERMRELVQTVAGQHGDCPYCSFLQMVANVDGDEHTPDCPVTKARAILEK